MAATPKRASHAEAALCGKPWSEASVAGAMVAIGHDFAPIDDWRASAAYRTKVAANLLRRVLIETTEQTTATRLVGDRSLAHA